MELIRYRHNGFTLIEMMVAMTISSIVIMAVYSAYMAQTRSQPRERLLLEMGQNIRAGVYLMKKEIRLAGYDPTKIWGLDQRDNDGDFDIDEADEMENDRSRDGMDNDSCLDQGSGPDSPRHSPFVIDEKFGIKVAGPHMIRFNMDLTGDRDICDGNEEVSFGFSGKYDRDRNGIADRKKGGAAPLGRAAGRGHHQPYVNNIESLAFAYAYDFHGQSSFAEPDGKLDLSPKNHIIWAFDGNGDGFLDRVLDTNDDGLIDGNDTPGGADSGNPVPIDRIRAVRIWLLGRSRDPVRGPKLKGTYVVGENHIKVDDRYGRVLYETIVKCPNL